MKLKPSQRTWTTLTPEADDWVNIHHDDVRSPEYDMKYTSDEEIRTM